MPDTTSQKKKKKTIIGTEKKIRFKVPWRREKAPVHSPKQKRPKKKTIKEERRKNIQNGLYQRKGVITNKNKQINK